MIRPLLVALLGAFLILAWTQPALAFRTITVQNSTDTLAHVDIIYRSLACRDDRIKLQGGSAWSNYIGICLIKSFTAWIEDPSGKGHACRPASVDGTEYRIILNRNPARDGYCIVRTSL